MAMKTLLMGIIFTLSLSPGRQVVANDSVKEIRVYKSKHRLELINNENLTIKAYKISLGKKSEGAKSEAGDNKTPEGVYLLDYKLNDSKFHRAFHISYPSTRDIIKARLRGKNPGRDIMLHGYPEDFSDMRDWLKLVHLDEKNEDDMRAGLGNYDWTDGCIAVTDAEIDEIYSLVDVPTKIIINP